MENINILENISFCTSTRSLTAMCYRIQGQVQSSLHGNMGFSSFSSSPGFPGPWGMELGFQSEKMLPPLRWLLHSAHVKTISHLDRTKVSPFFLLHSNRKRTMPGPTVHPTGQPFSSSLTPETQGDNWVVQEPMSSRPPSRRAGWVFSIAVLIGVTLLWIPLMDRG